MLTRMQLTSFGDTERGLAAKTVLVVSNSISNLAQGVSNLISSCIAMYLEFTCHFKVIADGHTHRQIDRQLRHNSVVTDSWFNYNVASKFVLHRKSFWLIIDWKKYSGPESERKIYPGQSEIQSTPPPPPWKSNGLSLTQSPCTGFEWLR